MALYSSMEQLIGNTPLVEASRYASAAGLPVRLLVKLEKQNPAGSAKDRVAAEMLRAAEVQGKLHPDTVIIEPTSGNTGVGLAALAALKGYKLILTMPDSMSEERRRLLAAYGAQLVLTPAAEGMVGAVKKAQELSAEYEHVFLPDQFANPANPAAHFAATGPEIWRDTEGRVGAFVAGIGTGGTVSGVGAYLKQQNPAVYVLGAEPAASPVLTKGESAAAPHKLQGMGANFVPKTFDRAAVDEICYVSDADAYAAARLFAKTEGLLVGVSSGAALVAARELAVRPAFVGKTVVVLLPDTGERYLSTPQLFEE